MKGMLKLDEKTLPATKGSKARKEIISMLVIFNVGIDIKLIII